MQEETLHSYTQFLLDTNALRYQATPGSPYQGVANRFWEKTLERVEKGELGLYTANEVVRELEVQSHSVHPDEAQIIHEVLLPQIEKLDFIYDAEAEHLVRQASAFLSHNYEITLPSGKTMKKYPGVGDARILLTAYENDCEIITANVNDFMLYPLLYPQTGKVLYDLLREQYVEIDPQLYERIQKDARFIAFKSKIEKYKII
ncbi:MULTISPECIES: PIN domain-containing protein [Bacillus cereus group]|uniref:DUF4411 family protein n=1 Tax=Bacillus cereus group TaxID=86661 RepID=UPI0021D308FB|nr:MULTISPECIES: DUF4411 family protein [Bacillus cereus group]MCU5070108.1 DUF4411 family protein [Bacillus pacificus]MCU5299657.1 DUF4411 family protein [Bacillus paranthracis]